jgi:hypothetical protein
MLKTAADWALPELAAASEKKRALLDPAGKVTVEPTKVLATKHFE